MRVLCCTVVAKTKAKKLAYEYIFIALLFCLFGKTKENLVSIHRTLDFDEYGEPEMQYIKNSVSVQHNRYCFGFGIASCKSF